MGAPLVANYQLAFYYPPIWLTFIFYLVGGNQGLATGVFFIVFLHVVWTGLGMVLLTRKLGMKAFAQIISSLAFSISGCFIARVNFLSMILAISWIPWILLICMRIIRPDSRMESIGRKQSRRFQFQNYFLLIWVIAMQLLAGHAQVTWYTFLLTIAWMGFWGWQHGKFRSALKNIFILGICATVASLLTAVQVFPTLEYLLQSTRASSVDPALAMNYSFWPAHLLNFFSPEFFGNPTRGDYWGFGAQWEDAVYFGFIPLLLAFLTIKAWFTKGKPNRNVIIFLWILFCSILLFALGKNLPFFPFLFRFVPTFNLFQAPARFMIIGVFCLTLLAGYGVEYWQVPTGRWLYLCRLGVMAGIAILTGAWLGSMIIKGDLVTLIRGSIFAGINLIIFCMLTLRMVDSHNSRSSFFIWISLATLIISSDLLINSYSVIPTTDLSFYSDQVSKTNLSEDGRLWIPADSEYDLKFERFFRFNDFRALEDWDNIRKVNLPNTNLFSEVSLVNNFDPFVPDRYQRLLNILEKSQGQNQTKLLQLMNVIGIERFDVNSQSGVQITAVGDSKEYWWYECAIFSKDLADSQTKLINLLNDPKEDIQSKLVIEAPGSSGLEPCSSAHPIHYESTFLSDNQRRIVVDNANPGWLMISSTYYPGWVALIDGKETPIYPAMIAFQSIHVPAGSHTIQFFYRPQSCYYGGLVSGLTLFGIFIAFMLNKKMIKEDKHGNKNDR